VVDRGHAWGTRLTGELGEEVFERFWSSQNANFCVNYRYGGKFKHLTVNLLGITDLEHVIDFRG
jgi:hypothetical protein